MESALIAELLAAPSVKAKVVKRINWVRRPQGEALPAIVLHVIDRTPDVHHGGASGVVQARVQVDCWAASYAAAKSLARAVETALTARAFSRGAVRFDVILSIAERDDSFEEAGKPVFRTSLDLMVHHAAAS
ncbi:MAG: DUF3168 domain-containing protein [Brevundimonas sp.]|uniref:DUF3168 domain-containing protein n=1 Tax=Brevundimonas sp. TaxID=1871086 RepID=UPI001228CE54|nr:DUF3168 domain-containing protein [Brevundimonas sp.]RZJ19122.1 MAG: DUF3168 domain-containing protein [Brevundimonas sp.]